VKNREDVAMAIVRWDPFREMADVRDRFAWLFSDYDGASPGNAVAGGTWLPAVDIYANDNHEYLITAELPDVNRDDIDVTVENNTLTLRGEKKMNEGVRNERFHRVERTYGTFRRSFTLPNTVDAAKVRAEFKDGVLTLRLPLREETKPTQIPIQVSG
jgi:HSP20 family protein